MDKMSSILIIGTYRQTLTVVRSLSRAGHRVILGVDAHTEPCQYSRYVDELWYHANIDTDPGQFVHQLKGYLPGNPHIESIFPVGETELRLFADMHDAVSESVSLLMCDPATLRVCLDKPSMSAIVDDLAIPQAQYRTAAGREELFAAADFVGYPCVVRPANSKFRLSGKKAVICHDTSDVKDKSSSWPLEIEAFVVQKFVPGPRRNVYFFSNDGHIEALAEVAILRTNQLDGTGLAVSGETVDPSPDLAEYCHRIARHLNYQGAGCAQFLLDPTSGETSFLELNPRLGANFAVVYHAGLDLPVMQLRLKEPQRPVSTPSRQSVRKGLRYAWVLGDLLGLKNAIAHKQVAFRGALVWLLATVKTNLTASVHVTWDWRDPLPTLVLFGRSFFAFLKRGKSAQVRHHHASSV